MNEWNHFKSCCVATVDVVLRFDNNLTQWMKYHGDGDCDAGLYAFIFGFLIYSLNKIILNERNFTFYFRRLRIVFGRISIKHTYICVRIYLVNFIWNVLADLVRFYFNRYELSFKFMAFLEFFRFSVVGIQAFSYGCCSNLNFIISSHTLCAAGRPSRQMAMILFVLCVNVPLPRIN